MIIQIADTCIKWNDTAKLWECAFTRPGYFFARKLKGLIDGKYMILMSNSFLNFSEGLTNF